MGYLRFKYILCLFILFLFCTCDPFNTQFEDVEYGKLYQARQKTPPPIVEDRLNVMTWNIKFGGARIDFFYDCHGDEVLMERNTVIDNLEGLAAKINQVSPDILLLQEVDIQSKRSAYVDMVQWLLDHTELNYGAYASNWKADYIPSDGLGRINSGIAILSRWPLIEATRIALPLREDQTALERYFFLKRAILTARIELPSRNDINAVSTHFSAFSKDETKRWQLQALLRELSGFDDRGDTFVMGGDLNMVPPMTAKKNDFPDEVCDDPDFLPTDFAREDGWIDPLYDLFQPAIDLALYDISNSRYFTHTTDKNGFWNRKLDYLFTNATFINGFTHRSATWGGIDTMPLSDHAPVTATFVISD